MGGSREIVEREARRIAAARAAATFSRRHILTATAAGGVSAATSVLGGHPQGVTAAEQSSPPGLTQRGINYDVGTMWEYGDSRLAWNDEVMRREITAIGDGLQCNAVLVHGTRTDRLIDTARFALEWGLTVWVQPRLMNRSQADTLANLVEVAAAAEALREDHTRIGINVGVECSLFTADIVPGTSFETRVDYLISHLFEMDLFNERLDDFLGRCRATVDAFGGPVTYSSGTWESVDWSSFDYAGIDHYRDVSNVAEYAGTLRSLAESGKPVIVTEFGCCTFVGAEDYGGDGWALVDYSTDPPTFTVDLVRSEAAQADEILALLDIFETENVHGAFVYQLIDQSMVHSTDPLLDLDKANFGLVKTFAPGMGKPDDPAYWEPKEAFLRLGDRWRSAG